MNNTEPLTLESIRENMARVEELMRNIPRAAVMLRRTWEPLKAKLSQNGVYASDTSQNTLAGMAVYFWEDHVSDTPNPNYDVMIGALAEKRFVWVGDKPADLDTRVLLWQANIPVGTGFARLALDKCQPTELIPIELIKGDSPNAETT